MFDSIVSLAEAPSCRETLPLLTETQKANVTACTCGRKASGRHSLDSGGDERHADHHQVQDVKVVPAEGAFMEEGPVRRHL